MTKKTPVKKTSAKSKQSATKEHATAKVPLTDSPRVVKAPKYSSFKLQKKIPVAQLGPVLPSAFRVFKDSVQIMLSSPKTFLGILFWFGLVNLVFIQGFSTGNVSSIKSSLDNAYQSGTGHVFSGLASFAYLLSTSSSSDSSTGLVQFIWIILVSLALIWTLRQVYAGRKPTAREGFYSSMFPLIPFILVICVMAVQLVPFIVGGTVFSAVVNNGIATSTLQIVIWALLFLALTILSLYFLCSSIFALYIVCLPELTPLKALRSARQLVTARRWTVARKLLFLPLVLGLANVAIMLPIIFLAPAIASWVFAIVSAFNLAIAHSYFYTLYRSLL